MEEIKEFTPREIVSALDHHIIGQKEAKRAVAIAMRNRWRRQQVPGDLRDEIAPKNIIMIGSTGVGKTEIARRLSKLANAPFIKVEASKFTEVGYVGKDVESMIRELVDIAINMVKSEEEVKVQSRAEELAEERILDLLIPKPKANPEEPPKNDVEPDPTREKLREMFKSGKLNSRSVDLETQSNRPMGFPMIEVVSAGGSLDEISKNLRDMMSNFAPKGRKRKKVKIPQAFQLLKQEEAVKLIEMDEVIKKAIERVENSGMVFIDEIDKIASRERASSGPDVSREGVQRDILPIVEGCQVNTKYGMVKTDHILFFAAGAFHVSKPSDLIPELQGRFPIRVELHSLTGDDFLRILTEPTNSLVRQYTALMATENVHLEFTPSGLKEMAHFAETANQQMENIGARRLHTILEIVLDEISFTASERGGEKYIVDSDFIRKSLESILKNEDLSRYIL